MSINIHTTQTMASLSQNQSQEHKKILTTTVARWLQAKIEEEYFSLSLIIPCLMDIVKLEGSSGIMRRMVFLFYFSSSFYLCSSGEYCFRYFSPQRKSLNENIFSFFLPFQTWFSQEKRRDYYNYSQAHTLAQVSLKAQMRPSASSSTFYPLVLNSLLLLTLCYPGQNLP